MGRHPRGADVQSTARMGAGAEHGIDTHTRPAERACARREHNAKKKPPRFYRRGLRHIWAVSPNGVGPSKLNRSFERLDFLKSEDFRGPNFMGH